MTFYTKTPTTTNIHAYLSLPLNNGYSYSDFSGRFCQKGGFFASAIGVTSEDMLLTPLTSLDENQDKHDQFKEAVRDFCGTLAVCNPDLLLALDIAEYIHMSGYPQKAKLYLATVIDKFNLDKIPLLPVTKGAQKFLLCNYQRNWVPACDLETREELVTTSIIGSNWMSPSWMTKIRQVKPLVHQSLAKATSNKETAA